MPKEKTMVTPPKSAARRKSLLLARRRRLRAARKEGVSRRAASRGVNSQVKRRLHRFHGIPPLQ